jgi:cytoskeletal protein CcmA (bactofilin family)
MREYMVDGFARQVGIYGETENEQIFPSEIEEWHDFNVVARKAQNYLKAIGKVQKNAEFCRYDFMDKLSYGSYIKQDGISAGLAFAYLYYCYYSNLDNRLAPYIAWCGCLNGYNVLGPVTHIGRKIQVAKENGIRVVILPEENKRQLSPTEDIELIDYPSVSLDQAIDIIRPKIDKLYLDFVGPIIEPINRRMDRYIIHKTVSEDKFPNNRNSYLLNKQYVVNRNTKQDGFILARKVTVESDCIIKGSVTGIEGVTIYDNCTITGDIISKGQVTIHANCYMSSVIADTIKILGSCRVENNLCCEILDCGDGSSSSVGSLKNIYIDGIIFSGSPIHTSGGSLRAAISMKGVSLSEISEVGYVYSGGDLSVARGCYIGMAFVEGNVDIADYSHGIMLCQTSNMGIKIGKNCKFHMIISDGDIQLDTGSQCDSIISYTGNIESDWLQHLAKFGINENGALVLDEDIGNAYTSLLNNKLYSRILKHIGPIQISKETLAFDPWNIDGKSK